VVGGVVAVVTASTYLVGATRPFGYDASVTMANFVVGDLGDVFGRQIVFNNHPMFSFVEHVVWQLTGSSSELTMRLAPAAFAAAAVGVLAWRTGLRLGVLAGAAAGVALAANPLLLGARDVRGYSLAMLTVVLMGVFVLDRQAPVGLAVALAVGFGTQLYVIVPAAALFTYLLVGGRLTRRWVVAFAAGMAGGVAAYAGMARSMMQSGRNFRPRFLLDAAYDLFGASAVAVAATLVLLLVAARPVRRDVAAAGAVLLGGVVGPWLLGPTHLYTRFLFFLAPVLAYVMATAVARRPVASVAVVVFAAGSVLPNVGEWRDGDVPNRELARAVPAGADVCGVGYSAQGLTWYLPEIRLRDERCEFATILQPAAHPEATARARELWPVLCWSYRGAELRAREGCIAAG